MDLPRVSPAKNPSSAVLKAKSNYLKKKYSPGGSGKLRQNDLEAAIQVPWSMVIEN